jgi:hypothetical protein
MSFGNRRLATPILATLIDVSELGMVQAQATKAPEGTLLAARVTAAGAGFSMPTAADVSVTPIQGHVLIDTVQTTRISCHSWPSETSPTDAGERLPILSLRATTDDRPAVAPQITPGHEIQAFAATLVVPKDTWNATGPPPLKPVTPDPTTMTTFDIMSLLERDSCKGASTFAARTEGDALIEGLPNGSYAMLVIATDGAVIAGSPSVLNAPVNLDLPDMFATLSG